MLTGIRLGNFKPFEEVQHIPIRPLTLIYGANSSGKSSIIHSLLFARHAEETGDLDVHRTSLGGEAVDLGGFCQFVHRRDPSRRLEWAADFDTVAWSSGVTKSFGDLKNITVVITIGTTFDDDGTCESPYKPAVYTYEVFTDGSSLLRMSRRDDGKLYLAEINFAHPALSDLVKNTIKPILPGPKKVSQRKVKEYVAQIQNEMAFNPVFPPTPCLPLNLEQEERELLTIVAKRNPWLTKFLGVIRLLVTIRVREIVASVNTSLRGELRKLAYLGPLRSYPVRHFSVVKDFGEGRYAGGGYAWDVVRRDEAVRERVNAWLTAPDRLQTPYELSVRKLIAVDELADAVAGLDEDGVVLSDYSSFLTTFYEEIMDRLAQTMEELVLLDKKSSTAVSHRDIGIGVSQVLPVLVTAFASQNRIIAIEQPEIHLHPALQADLGDVFLQSALGGQGNRFLIESHSEHLLLRLMRRMRETANGRLPEGFPPVRPADVAVLFVQPKGTSSAVRQLELDEEGQLLDPWPGGFFEEGYRERFAE